MPPSPCFLCLLKVLPSFYVSSKSLLPVSSKSSSLFLCLQVLASCVFLKFFPLSVSPASHSLAVSPICLLQGLLYCVSFKPLLPYCLLKFLLSFCVSCKPLPYCLLQVLLSGISFKPLLPYCLLKFLLSFCVSCKPLPYCLLQVLLSFCVSCKPSSSLCPVPPSVSPVSP